VLEMISVAEESGRLDAELVRIAAETAPSALTSNIGI